MGLSDILFNFPVTVQKCKNLQNPVGTNQARCLRNNRDIYEQLVLRFIEGNKVAIQSVRNSRYLQVRLVNEQSMFTMETIFFVSCFTGNVLQCDDELIVRCSRKDRLAWMLIEPQFSNQLSTTSHQRLHQYSLTGKARQDLMAKGCMTPDRSYLIYLNMLKL